jgi:hypothetical protein
MPPRNQHVGLIGDGGAQIVLHRHLLRRQLDDIRSSHHRPRTGLQLNEPQRATRGSPERALALLEKLDPAG